MMERKRLLLICGVTVTLVSIFAQVAVAQRNNQNSDEDDFDDAGFDDSGYNQPQRDTESSNHNPNNYSPSDSEDLDDDDEVDESHMSPQVAEDSAEPGGRDDEAATEQHEQQQPQHQQQQHQQQQVSHMPFLDHVQTQNFYAPPSPMLVANLHPAGLAPFSYGGPGAHIRYRRSLRQQQQQQWQKPEGDIEDGQQPDAGQSVSLVRRKRGAKGHHKSYIGPVYTYVKTDKHANFKWGVKHKVGKHYG